MACYHPVPALQDRPGGPVRLNPPVGTENFQIPCGTCLGCRQMRATYWARRCVHEASLSRYNVFLTLTEDDAHCNGDLSIRKLQLFFKRLRKSSECDVDAPRLFDNNDLSIRYFACGEYGERTGRPHYHVVLFNFDVSDKYKVGMSHGKELYESPYLMRLWPDGGHRLGVFGGGAAGYVAKYALKASARVVVDSDGVVRQRPFLVMSRRPGIGAGWLSRYSSDLRSGRLVMDGRAGSIPRAYRKRLAVEAPALSAEIEDNLFWPLRGDGHFPARLASAELIHQLKQASPNERRVSV